MGLFDFLKKKTTAPMQNTAVFTTKHIMLEDGVITRVYHHVDDSYSFMDSHSSNANENIMIVGLGQILKRDSTIGEIINIPPGHSATRIGLKGKWVVAEFIEEIE